MRPLQNKHKSTALMLACQENNTAAVKMLLAYSADMGLQDSHGATAVMRACFLADGAPLVRTLVRMCEHKTAMVNIQAEDGTTALMVAAERGRTDSVKHLLQEGRADVRLVDSNGDSALVLARRRCNNGEVRGAARWPWVLGHRELWGCGVWWCGVVWCGVVVAHPQYLWH